MKSQNSRAWKRLKPCFSPEMAIQKIIKIIKKIRRQKMKYKSKRNWKWQNNVPGRRGL
jgi:hypothetical protein